jgi:hypothetical protein
MRKGSRWSALISELRYIDLPKGLWCLRLHQKREEEQGQQNGAIPNHCSCLPSELLRLDFTRRFPRKDYDINCFKLAADAPRRAFNYCQNNAPGEPSRRFSEFRPDCRQVLLNAILITLSQSESTASTAAI